MKKIFTFIVLVVSFAGMAQAVTITTDKTAIQLINEVLVSSSCFQATNVTSKSGNDFGSTNGIGYFSNINPDDPNAVYNTKLPFKSGVVITTGDVTKVPSPNNTLQGNGTAAWPGDTDLQTALAAQGVTINSINASKLEFDFIAKQTTFNMSFIFASEEYGDFQCNFSDAFAFLIKDVTASGSYQNIATVPAPAPTGTPITVATIRDATYNPLCSSVNAQFFGAYNGSGFGPAINFNGQTVPMVASTSLIFNHKYHVKLVIADGNNNVGSDSAIFLEAQSLNIGAEVLGLDYIAANANQGRTSVCTTPYPTLQPSVPLEAGTTYVWKKLLNGAFSNMAGFTSSSLDLNNVSPPLQYFYGLLPGTNVYSLTYTIPGCAPITDQITLFLNPAINSLAVVPPLNKCLDPIATSYTYDLTKTGAIILDNNTPTNPFDNLAGVSITYHTSIANAENNIAVGNSITITAAQAIAGFDMWAKIKNNNTSCYELRNFKLKLVAAPVIVAPPVNLTLCGLFPAPTPMANFDINNNIALILGTGTANAQDPAIYDVLLYLTQANANSGVGGFAVGSGIRNSPTTTFFVRVQNASDPTCFVTTSFTVTVTPLAYVDILPDVIVCDNFVLPPLTQPGAQYWTLVNGTGVQHFSGDVIIPGATPTTLFVFNSNGTCLTNDPFKITKSNVALIAPTSASYCREKSLDALAYGVYYKNPGGPSANPDGPILPGYVVNTTGANDFYVYYENLTETPVCSQEKLFTVTIIPLADLPTYDNVFSCSSYILPPAGNGATYYNGPGKTLGAIATGTSISSSKTIYVYKETGTTPNCFTETSFEVSIGPTNLPFTPTDVDSCAPYMLPTLTIGQFCSGPNGLSPYPANFVIQTVGQTTVYYFIPGQSCTANLSFKVNVSLLPLDPIADVVVCDSFTFPVVPGRPNGKYYKTPGAPSGSFRSQGDTIYTLGAQTYYFKEQASSGPCFVEEPFLLTINETPALSQRPPVVQRCNQSFILDDLADGEYYKNQGGLSATNPVLAPGTIFTLNDPGKDYCEIFAYAGSTAAGNTCHQEYSIKIYFVNTNVNPVANVTACDSYTLPAIVGLGDYYTMSGGPLVTGNQKIILPKIITTTTTLYVYAENNYRLPCSDEESFTVTIVKTPNLNPVAAKTVCDSYTVPQYNDAMFTFTATNPGTVTKFYKNAGGATANPLASDVYTPNQVITNINADFSPLVVTLYPYTEALGTGVTCFDDEPLLITINRTPVLPTFSNITACDTYTLPVLTLGKYYPNALHNASEEWDTLVERTLTATTTPVYVYAETGTTPNCAAAVQSFDVNIVTTPIVSTILPVSSCDTYTVPQYSDAMFTSTNPITKFYKNAGGPANNSATTDEYSPGDVITAGPDPTIVTIYAYSAVGSVPCFDDEPFVVTINKSPVIVPAEIVPITACDSYNLPALTVGKYYSAPTHLPSEELAVGFAITDTTAPTTIYVYAENPANPNCTASADFIVTIVPTPAIGPIAPVFGCDSYTIPAYSNPMFSSTNPITKFYKNAGGPANNPLPSDQFLPAQVIPYLGINNAPYVFNVFAYSAVGSVPCFDDQPFVVTINKSPVIVASEVVPVTKCDSYTLPALTVGSYVTSLGAPLGNLTITTTQTVYVRAINGVLPNTCVDNKNFLVTINKTPQFTPAEVADVSTCNAYILPALSIPGAKYYTAPNGPTGGGTEIILPKTYTSDATVYPYAETGTTPNCFVSESIDIQVYNVVELADVVRCGSYTLPALADPNVKYYNSPGQVGLITLPSTLTTSQTVYVVGTSPSGCFDESDFVVTINGQPIANDVAKSVCDTDSSPYDGITPYDLTTLIPSILGTSQLPTDFTVTFYSDFNRQVLINNPAQCTLPIVYVFVTNNASTTCPSPAVININVIPLPNPKLDTPPICIDSETGVVTNSVIESGYNSLDYTIVWTMASDGTVVSNDQSFSTDVPGDYILNVTSNDVTTCVSGNVPFTVIQSAKPAVTPPVSFEITGWFTNYQTITVNATPYVGDGSNFVYSLDGGTPQVSNIFKNVGIGAHEITVIDINGCGSRALPIPVTVVNSPAAFTPNGDGINDKWDIEGDILYSTLTIYDRFGRLLKQLTQKNNGWDGTINNQALPADDYWFTLNYIDSSGTPREYKSHFSLIR